MLTLINSRTIIHINLNKTNIEIVTFYTVLDVIIDNKMNWKKYILHLKSKLKKFTWINIFFSKFSNKKALFHI